MTERIKKRMNELLSEDYKALRCAAPRPYPTSDEAIANTPRMDYVADYFCYALSEEIPVIHEGDPIGFYRYCPELIAPPTFRETKGNNITADYEGFLATGINGFRQRIAACEEGADEKARNFYGCAKRCLDACESYITAYRDALKAAGEQELYEALCRVPMSGATTYAEALISVKFIQFILRINQNNHITLGRFDQYMKPYFDASLAAGATEEELLELTELFFLSLNFDTDLYFGVQKGDNGQSLVLGGYRPDGSSAYNELTDICLTASEELKLIDPKINLRVNKTTPLSVYKKGTRLTKQGLGFPQYLNDDVIVPGLIALGYEPQDAWDYSVAACWEPIIPRYGCDVPNITRMNFPEMVRRATINDLPSCKSFEDFRQKVRETLEAECSFRIEAYRPGGIKKVPVRPDALFSLFLLPCIESGRDISDYGAKYNNYGMHGVGIAPAADAMEAIKRAVFEDRIVTAEELVRALESDFSGFEELQGRLLDYPKMGNNEDSVDGEAAFLMAAFGHKLNRVPNGVGGFWRAGTGSALEYYQSAIGIGATADGRRSEECFGANFSPALTTRVSGPLSVIQSFTKYDLTQLVNGGPLTLELHDTVFRNEEGEEKVAMLVKSFIALGGHELQLNAISRQTLLDAQMHPEKYPNLIVRVWGWSGYFNELAQPYQEHVIQRTEFTI